MIWRDKAALSLFTFAVIGFFATPVFAGLLDTGTPYFDGVTTWKGTTPFEAVGNPNLKGHVDWIVFEPGDFPFSGYGPTNGELAYAYQVFSEGSDDVAGYLIPLDNLADNIGSFSDPANGVTGDAPIYMDLVAPGSAYWEFAGIAQGTNSEGLAYSSINKPMDWYSIVINGGTIALAEPIPAPATTPIPEPTTLWSLMIALGLLGMWRLRRS
ncbi:MAG TPA: PEP-CTERM sorting domain-containing protein [Thermoguttaceae bacterium]